MPAIGPADECVDVGTGSGGFAIFFARHGRWTFVELDPAHVAAAQRVLDGTFVQNEGVAFLATKTGRFRLITTFGTLYYISDQQRFFQVAAQSLVDGGHLVASGDDISVSRAFRRLRKVLRIEALTIDRHDIPYEEFRRRLEGAGFTIVQEARSTGPVTLFVQTILDGLMVFYLHGRRMLRAPRPVQAGITVENDLLTRPVSDVTGPVRWKRLIHLPLRAITEITQLLDHLLWFLPRYDYVIRARVERPVVKQHA